MMLVRPALGMNGNTLDGRKPISHTAGFLVLAIALSVVLVIAISSYRDSVASERVSERREINE
jgi:ABC-type Na+ efflux pump permease subunit